jgi:hypothetical protein
MRYRLNSRDRYKRMSQCYLGQDTMRSIRITRVSEMEMSDLERACKEPCRVLDIGQGPRGMDDADRNVIKTQL